MVTLADVLKVAQERLAAGDARAALDLYRQVLDRLPSNSDALFGYLRAAMASGNPSTIETAQRQVEQVYRDAGAATQLAVAQAQLGDALRTLEEAGRAIEQALKTNPNMPEVQGTAFLVGQHLGNFRQYFSQFGQDRYLHQHLFANQRGGVFVDVGAYDGFSGSNTLFFEKFMGWTGLCIEPDPVQFGKLAEYRSCERVQACIADKEGTARFLNVADGLTMMGGLVDYYEPQDLRMIAERSKTRIVELPTVRLDTVLKQHNIDTIDYLSIDTEGSELAILKAFDFGRYNVKALSVENNRNAQQIPDFLQSAGYRRIARLGVDDIYAR